MASSGTHVSAFSATSSGLHQSITGGSHIHRETLQERIAQWRQWLFSTDYHGKRILMGRSLKDWMLLIGSYVAFFVFLVGMFLTLMSIFYAVVHRNFPTIQGPSSILQTPGIGFRPQPDISSTVIRFIKGDAVTSTAYVDHLEAYLKYYENQNQQGEKFIDCEVIGQRRLPEDMEKACRFDLNSFGKGHSCVKEQSFGYGYGQPCILLKLNKVFNWIPEEYTSETVPAAIRDSWNQWYITVTCHGETATDRENMGDLAYYPTNGWHFKYFPFRSQESFRSPLVFVQFMNPRPGILLMITCKAWAKNINHDLHEMIGTVHFELLVD